MTILNLQGIKIFETIAEAKKFLVDATEFCRANQLEHDYISWFNFFGENKDPNIHKELVLDFWAWDGDDEYRVKVYVPTGN